MSELSPSPSSCPYLGLPDDARTSLAYPSLWNHCYRVNHPAAIALAHQSHVCLHSFDQCPVYKAGERSSLQADLLETVKTARQNQVRSRTWIRILLIALLAAFVVGGVFLAWSVLNMETILEVPGLLGSPVNPTVAQASRTEQAPHEQAVATSAIATSSQTAVTQLPATVSVSPELAATQESTSSATAVCGHQLDLPFGEDVQFILHRILPGENLTRLAFLYQTTEQSIVAINYDLPIPIWADLVVVIPIGVENTGDLPLFETYQQVDQISMQDLALKLNVDPQALQKYNHFTQSCSRYSGWLLIPHAADESLE